MGLRIVNRKLPYPRFVGMVAVLILIGLAASVYLSISHYKVHTDLGYASFCSITGAINCDSVSQSPYEVFRDVPSPLGGIGYLGLALLLFQGWLNRVPDNGLWTLMLFLSLGYSLISIILLLVWLNLVGSYCVVCILTYLVNMLLAYRPG